MSLKPVEVTDFPHDHLDKKVQEIIEVVDKLRADSTAHIVVLFKSDREKQSKIITYASDQALCLLQEFLRYEVADRVGKWFQQVK